MPEVEVYDSFAVMPLDEEPEWEGDDTTDPLDRPQEARFLTLAHAIETPKTYKLVVPYPGLLHEGMVGDPVYGVKRMVHRYDGTLMALQASPLATRRRWGGGTFGFTGKLKRAQKRAGLAQTGVWDKATHNRFAPYADSFAITLVHPQVPKPSREQIQRNAVLSFLMAFYNRRYNISYSQSRPTQLRPVKKITQADCSGSVATGMWTGDVLPHVDWRYTNTRSQIKLGVPVASSRSALVGDVAFYGHGSDASHETCVVSHVGDDVRVFSFGAYPARILNIDYNRGRLGGRIALRRFIL